MKIKTLVLASCLSFSVNSFATTNSNTETLKNRIQKITAYCKENPVKCAFYAAGTTLATAATVTAVYKGHKYFSDKKTTAERSRAEEQYRNLLQGQQDIIDAGNRLKKSHIHHFPIQGGFCTQCGTKQNV